MVSDNDGLMIAISSSKYLTYLQEVNEIINIFRVKYVSLILVKKQKLLFTNVMCSVALKLLL